MPNKLNAIDKIIYVCDVMCMCDLNDISKFSAAVFSFFGSIYRCTLLSPIFHR